MIVNMMSHADLTKGHGVLSVYEELVAMLRDYYPDRYEIRINKLSRADIYHYHTINPTFFLSLPIVRRRKGAIVGFVHFLPKTMEDSLKLPKIFKIPFYKYIIWFYKAMEHIVVVNPHFIPDLEAAGIDPARITYIPNCVSTNRFFQMNAEEKRQVREKLGLSPDRHIVIGIGQLQIRKGVFDFVEMARRNPDKDFLWLGGFSFGKISDGHDEIQKLMDNPPENMRFLGIIDRNKMNDYYNAADLLLLPSFQELFPVTILEALNCGTPIVARTLPEYEGIVSDYCLLRSDSDGFDDEIRKLCENPDYHQHAQQLAKAGAAFYSTENVAKMWDAFYTRITDQATGKKDTGVIL